MDATGVVDGMRPLDAVRRTYRGASPIARVFTGLVVVDVIARTLGLVQPAVDLSPARPLSLVASFLPHDLLILLPAFVIVRLPRAIELTPWVISGAIVIGLVELVALPLSSLAPPTFPGSVAIVIVTGLGWIGIGWGLAAINPKGPPPTVAGVANLVAVAILFASAALAILPLAIPRTLDLNDPVQLDLVIRTGVLGFLASVAWAWVLRAVVRGYGDPRRPSQATSLSTLAAIIAGVLAVGVAAITIFGRVDPAILAPLTRSPIYVPMVWLGSGGAMSLLVVAFGLGLADPYSRVGGMILD
jgi:hypothetical protein